MWIKRYIRKQINHVVPNKKNTIRILVHADVPKILIRELFRFKEDNSKTTDYTYIAYDQQKRWSVGSNYYINLSETKTG